MEDVSSLFNMGSDFSDIDKCMSLEEFKSDIVNNLKPILSEVFSNCVPKQQIQMHHDRISIACPYCGDSTKNFYAKRGNFILGGKHAGFYKCHNCSIYMRIDNFFKDFKVSLKLDAINYLSSVANKYDRTSMEKYDMSYLLDMGSIEKYAIDREDFKKWFGLIEVKQSTILSWLNDRLQFKYEKFLFDPLHNKLEILNLTPNGKIIGTQKRLFGGVNRFESYKLSKLYDAMRIPMDKNEDWEYLDTLSMLFNVCLVDFSKEVTVFEGPMDSFLFKNSIANTGANKIMPIDVPMRYWYDYDVTGIKKSIEYLGKGEKVFLWTKFLNEYELPVRNKWDLNYFIIYARDNKVKIPNFNKYFSNDQLDIIDI